MKGTGKSRPTRVAGALILSAGLAILCGHIPCHAQSYGSALLSALPLNTVERYLGPIVPESGIGSTFRSEVCTAISMTSIEAALLDDSRFSDVLDLKDTTLGLDEYPNRYEVSANLRLWRLGLRMAYSNFENRSRLVNRGALDFTGFRLGGDLDAIQLTWLTLGVAADHYFYRPMLKGRLVTWTPADTPNLWDIDISGEEPTTVGPYMRYAPPEILGFPVHFEAFYNIPVGGSKITTYGAALIFRPQIYRFDVAAKIGYERTHLDFSADHVNGAVTRTWDLGMEWSVINGELAVYF